MSETVSEEVVSVMEVKELMIMVLLKFYHILKMHHKFLNTLISVYSVMVEEQMVMLPFITNNGLYYYRGAGAGTPTVRFA